MCYGVAADSGSSQPRLILISIASDSVMPVIDSGVIDSGRRLVCRPRRGKSTERASGLSAGAGKPVPAGSASIGEMQPDLAEVGAGIGVNERRPNPRPP